MQLSNRIRNQKSAIKMYASPENYIPQIISNRRPLLMWLIAALGCLAVMSLILAAPLASSAGHPAWAFTIYRAFSYFCHQIPERSFFIAGHQFAVCSRCTGIYAGFAAATIVYPLVRSLRQTEAPPRKWLFLAAAPLAIDFALGFFGIWENTHSSRFAYRRVARQRRCVLCDARHDGLELREWRRSRNIQQLRRQARFADCVFSPKYSHAAPSDYSAPDRRI